MKAPTLSGAFLAGRLDAFAFDGRFAIATPAPGSRAGPRGAQ